MLPRQTQSDVLETTLPPTIKQASTRRLQLHRPLAGADLAI